METQAQDSTQLPSDLLVKTKGFPKMEGVCTQKGVPYSNSNSQNTRTKSGQKANLLSGAYGFLLRVPSSCPVAGFDFSAGSVNSELSL